MPPPSNCKPWSEKRPRLPRRLDLRQKGRNGRPKCEPVQGAAKAEARSQLSPLANGVRKTAAREIYRETFEGPGAGTACATAFALGSLREYFNRQYRARTPSFHPIFLPSSYV